MMTSASVDAETRDFLAEPRFHQHLTLPTTSDHGELDVTYAVAGVDDENAPMVLLIGGMFGGRWLVVGMHYLAVKMGIRIACCDRPGLGGSTPVALRQRIPVWLETVPALLTNLKVHFFSIISHSSGTLFLLNTLYHLPHTLHPQTPYVALLAPWVHHDHSGVMLMTVASMIPAPLIGNYWSSICMSTMKMYTASAPVFGASSAVLGNLTGVFKSAANKEKTEEITAEMERKYHDRFGMGVQDKEHFDRLVMERGLGESTSGGNDEAMLCLKKAAIGLWGVAEDYESFVLNLAKVWEMRFATIETTDIDEDSGGKADRVEERKKLKIHAFFAEEDIMIGAKGQRFFDTCFEGRCGDAIEYESETVKGTDHDSIISPGYGPIAKVFEDVKTRAGG